jgi:ABC-type sugar transport system ATPase subunit
VHFGLVPDAQVGQLRLADQQKVEILRALARNASLIVMDEPTSALARGDARHLADIIRRLKREGTTVVYISHDLAAVLDLADDVTIMKDGRVVRTSSAKSETVDSLVQGMLGRTYADVFPRRTHTRRDASPVLAVRGLTRRGAFRDISFDVWAGEIVGLAGLVGAGRSEVARAVFGADRTDEGTVAILGRPAELRRPEDGIRMGIAMLPESRKSQGLVMTRSTQENITLPHLAEVSDHGVLKKGREFRKVSALLADLDVRPADPRVLVSRLSGGNQQKVLLAKWLFARPKLLLVDEPTRGVDVGAKEAIYAILTRLAREGMAILLISSETEELLGLAHRILVMRTGALVGTFDGASASEEDILEAAFGTSESADDSE